MKVKVIQVGKNVRVELPKETITSTGAYQVELTMCETKELYEKLKNLTDEQVKHDDKRYWDDISTYKNDVERTLGLSNQHGQLHLHLIVYTDGEDDNWIELTPKRTAHLAGMLYPYSIPYK